MSDHDHYDVIVIGSGAGGGTLAHRLAPGASGCCSSSTAGTSRASATTGIPASSSGGSTCPPSPGTTQPEVNYYVEGNTRFYGAALFRLRPEDFGELKHHDGISPAWPIDYADLEPYYTEAEHLYLVHGRHGEDPVLPAGEAWHDPIA